jgi:hypothetical protein
MEHPFQELIDEMSDRQGDMRVLPAMRAITIGK